MNTFHLRIVTMDGKVFDDQASQIFLRTIDGDVAIRAGHINYCSGIGMGQAHVTLADGHERYAACIGGMVVSGLTVFTAQIPAAKPPHSPITHSAI